MSVTKVGASRVSDTADHADEAELEPDEEGFLRRLLDHLSEPPTGDGASWWPRLACFFAMLAWGIFVWLDKLTDMTTVLHLTVILFHEAGHIVFMPFGEVMGVAGGSLGQLLMPLICCVALVRYGDNFGASMALAWMALSGMDVAVYAYDAADPVLPLLSGGTGADGAFHDFIFLFEHFGQLPHARGLAMVMKGVGTALFALSMVWGLIVLFRQKDEEHGHR